MSEVPVSLDQPPFIRWGLLAVFKGLCQGLVRIHLPKEHIQGDDQFNGLVLIETDVLLQFVIRIFKGDPGVIQGFLGIEYRKLDPAEIIFRDVAQPLFYLGDLQVVLAVFQVACSSTTAVVPRGQLLAQDEKP